MATKEEDLTLENCLNNATNPAHKTEDWDAMAQFTELVNNEIEGPHYAVRLLAHKIQSPIEREALYALTVIELCIKNCGRRFHNEIGKFRFLNELIKVISPKYLGTKTSERVKTRCIELIYCWHKGLPHEPKIAEAYVMLKQQGIVKEDPKHMDEASLSLPKPPPAEERRAPFEDDEKAKLLAKLLKSKNPDDLQAANRLIKNMVKQDSDRIERVSRRINELEAIHSNVKLLNEMVSCYSPQSTTESEKEMMKELYESLEKLRPKLFRLASETEECDTDALQTILKANDEVSLIMADYKKTVEGITQNGQGDNQRGGGSSLVDLAFDQPPAYTANMAAQSFGGLDDEMLHLGTGLRSPSTPGTGTTQTSDSLLSDLDSIFTSAAPTQQTNFFPGQQMTTSLNTMSMNNSVSYPGMGTQAGVSLGNYQPLNPMQTSQPPVSTVPATKTGSVFDMSPAVPSSQAMEDLDLLGQSLMQQSLSTNKASYSFEKPVPVEKKTLNQLASSSQATPVSWPAPTFSTPVQPQAPVAMTSKPIPAAMVSHPPPVSTVTGSMTTTVMGTSQATPNSGEVQPLTDVFVPLESIKPGTTPPVTAYDKNGLKVLILVTQNTPRDDVTVMVISVISINTVPVKSFVFQAAVPKIMKVKLQPPSGTDLPAFNPILPPSAITQVLLLANPQQEKIRLKFKISYMLNDQMHSDVGDIDGFGV
ncbi:ADP-ribosylation factor-binding protein GGA1-like isoform X3 [Mya arenaria]|uniref:ADP-ribosylation factor-binding protein GGA1-like isoform X3 n=1 Tax=Mya arenaria TaxID=6604 RepID=UPI0022E24F6A|nr:ADP-ribosylation factor-binding protein GGA1-like isoform X3 [Mya arenaria]XP_052782225.1 ADP-ribosylation factor-binding protein GGA1-like isoform X3 [Mya arenaria]